VRNVAITCSARLVAILVPMDATAPPGSDHNTAARGLYEL